MEIDGREDGWRGFENLGMFWMELARLRLHASRGPERAWERPFLAEGDFINNKAITKDRSWNCWKPEREMEHEDI